MHWCNDESLALMSVIPFIGVYFRRAHAWLHSKLNHKCHTKGCPETHTDHFQSRLDEATSQIKPLTNPPANDNQEQEVCGGCDHEPEGEVQ